MRFPPLFSQRITLKTHRSAKDILSVFESHLPSPFYLEIRIRGPFGKSLKYPSFTIKSDYQSKFFFYGVGIHWNMVRYPDIEGSIVPQKDGNLVRLHAKTGLTSFLFWAYPPLLYPYHDQTTDLFTLISQLIEADIIEE